ncbi:MAG: hypothetical protein QHJ82_08055 [Verrucomicrobiota bacterium]|nr:hypothetical protein [Verrucomicrobiota bacterium]
MSPIQFASGAIGAIIGLVGLRWNAWRKPDRIVTADVGGLASDPITRLVPKRTFC